jgi:signal transduction histidine kinase
LVKSTINGVLKEVRSIATGLVLPELANKSLLDTLRMITDVARMRTNSTVSLECGNLPDFYSPVLNDTVYRFVQEALNNSYQHAGGLGQKVKATVANRVLKIEVSDTGHGFDVRKAQSLPDHLGLAGMRNRILASGGEFEIDSQIGKGTRLVARIPLAKVLKSGAKKSRIAIA